MVSITFITADGRAQRADIEPGGSLLEGAVGNGIDGIDAECGGNCYCGTCRVHVDPQWQALVGPAGEYELPVIDAAGDQDSGVRLSCQIPVTLELDGMVVRLPTSQT
jgi:2Fe-2S ferredoxin